MTHTHAPDGAAKEEERMSEKEDHVSIGAGLPAEMARVRDVIMPRYAAIGPAGRIALAFMREDLADAEKAIAAGDVVAMVRLYRSLKETE